ncbi:TPA: hypothetical protein ACX6SJ_000339 [Photobacterium damselae]
MKKQILLLLLSPLASLASSQNIKTEITPWNTMSKFALTAKYHNINQIDQKWRETWTSDMVKTTKNRTTLQFSYNAGYGRNACDSIVLPSHIELSVSGKKAFFSAWCDMTTTSEFLMFTPLDSISEVTIIEAFMNNSNVVTFTNPDIPALNFQLSTNNFKTLWKNQ